MSRKVVILFLCTGNSCRSQMAEGWARQLRSEDVAAFSAGIEKHGLNPLAVKAMADAGVDITHQSSKTVDELAEQQFDYVITLCGHANETCPLFPGNVKRIHVGFDDPPALSKGAKTAEEAFVHYCRVRDEIRHYIESLPDSLT